MVLRLIGRYSHMMTVLKPIAKQVWTGICQLFQYYLYSVHLFFTGDNTESEAQLYSQKASLLLSFVYNTVVLHEIRENEISKLVGCVREPKLAATVILDQDETMFGLSERIVAIESVHFLAKELLSLQIITNTSFKGIMKFQRFMKIVSVFLQICGLQSTSLALRIVYRKRQF